MALSKLSRWLPTSFRRTPAVRRPVRPTLALHALEAREVPATLFTWTGNGGNSLWSTDGNWSGNAHPTAAVTDATLAFPAGAFSIDDVAGLDVDRITFAGGNTVLLQQQLGLDGSAPGDQVVASGAASSIAGVGGMNLFGAASQVDVTAGSSLVFSTALSGTGVLRKVGAGTLEVTGQASYTGVTQVFDGVLALNNAQANVAVSNNTLQIGDGSGAAGTAEVRLLDFSEIPNGAPITINADGVLNLNGHTETVGAVTLAGGSIKTANSTLSLNGNVTATADSAIDIGTASGALDLGSANRTFDVAAGKTLTITAQIIGTGGVVKTGAGTLTFDSVNGLGQFNTYTGTTTVNDGTLALDNDKSDGAFGGNLVIGDGAGAAGTAVVKYLQGGELSNANPVTVNADGLLNLNGNNDTVGPITLAGGQVATGSGLLTLGGNVTTTANAAAASITGNVSFGFADRTFTVADGAAASDLVFSGVLSGAAGLIKDGTGTLEIQGAAGSPNTFTGATVKLGTLLLNENGVDEAIPGTLVIGDGVGAAGTAVVRLAQSSEIANGTVVTILGDGLFDLNNHNDTIGGLNLTAGQVTTGTGVLTLTGDVIALGAAASATITGNLNLGAADRTFLVANGSAASDLILDGVITGTGGLIKDGAGTLEIKGLSATPNTYTGTTTIKDGVLALNDNGFSEATSKTIVIGDAVGSAGTAVLRLLQSTEMPDDATITVKVDGVLDLNTHNDVIGSLILSGGQVATGTGTLTLNGDVTGQASANPASITGNLSLATGSHAFAIADGAAATDVQIDAKIGGNGGFVKSGLGTLALNGTNSYTGATSVTAGSMFVNGSSPNSPIAVSGGILGGTGSVGTVAATGGAVSPGVGGPGTLTTKDLSLNGATVVVSLDGPAAGQFDQIKVVGSVDLTGANLNKTLNFASAVGSKFAIVDNDGADAVVGTFAGLSNGATFPLAGRTFRISYQAGDGNDVVLTDVTPNTPPIISDVGNQITGGSPVGPVAFSVNDAQTPVAALSVTATSSNLVLIPNANIQIGGAGANRTVTLTPVAGQSGSATITLTVTDTDGGSASDTFVVTVSPAVNVLPTITDVGNQSSTGSPVGPLVFTIGDVETAAAALTVTASSSNPGLAAVAVNGSGANRTVTVTPATGQSGTATITLTVTDGTGGSAIDTFDVTVTPSAPPPPAAIAPRESAVGADKGGTPTVRYLDATGAEKFNFDAFPGGFAGGVRTAAADFNGDGIADIVVGTGPGSATHVRVIDGATKAELFAIDPFEASFTGGVYVAAGDITGDGRADLMIAPDEGGGPRVRVFSGNGFGQVADFLGIEDPNFRGGARVAVGDIDGDGVGDLVVAAGFGGGPRVAAFSGKTLGPTGGPKVFPDFLAFEPGLRNGTFVAVGDVNGDGFAELIGGGGPGGGPRVSAFDGQTLAKTGNPVRTVDFFAGDVTNRGGVRLAVKDLDGDQKADLVTGAGTDAGSRVTGYTGASLAAGSPATVFGIDAFPGFNGGVFVG